MPSPLTSGLDRLTPDLLTPDLLTRAQGKAFDAHARRLGHDPGQLLGDAELVSYPPVLSVVALRALAAASAEQRAGRQRVFFGPSIAIRRSIGQGVHDRLEAAIFADGQIDPADDARANLHFPFPTRILSVRHRDVGPGECWDISVRDEHWDIDYRDDIMNVVNVGSLHLAPGATVAARGNLLVLIVQRIICDAQFTRDAPCQLAVLPVPYPVDRRVGPLDGLSGVAGHGGTDGPDGVTAPTEATWLGSGWLTEPVVPGACDARDGTGGANGTNGTRGRNGGPSKIAEITIGELTGPLTLVATAGRGGDGGAGGNGGNGGVGGRGADGQRTMQSVLPPGRGGAGGDGGHGGHGGRGGDGGISSNVFVSLPPSQEGLLRVLSHPAPGGQGSQGGVAGSGGRAGSHGTPAAIPGSPSPEGHRDPASPGRDGTRGRDGIAGRSRPAPPVFVNERLVEPMPGPAPVGPLTTEPATGGQQQ
jgi:hypothetical protein